MNDPCSNNNGGCSEFCLLSATASDGYSCACSADYVLTANLTHCIGMYVRSSAFYKSVNNILAPPRILFSMYNNRIQRVNPNGQNLVNLYTVAFPRALDFDFELV